jgi:hypothetical protein
VISDYPSDDPLTFAGDPEVKGAMVLRVDRQPKAVEFDLVPQAGQTSAEVVVPLSCNSFAACGRYRVDLSQPKVDGLILTLPLKGGC